MPSQYSRDDDPDMGPSVGILSQYILNVSDLTAVYVFGLTNTLPWVNTQGGLDPQDCP
ncbi:MAG: hypothetical protein ACYTFA_18340 [Planctomycetota bacterium]